MNNCPKCHHDVTSHNDGTCHVTQSGDVNGVQNFPGGCGCTFLQPDSICTACGKPFVCGNAKHAAHECRACWQRAFDEKTADSFSPLVVALHEHGLETPPAWNTGGGVMCLPFLFFEGEEQPYALFSDHAELMGAGIYMGDEASLMLTPDWEHEFLPIGDDWLPEGWATPGAAERTAAWFAEVVPIIREWWSTVTKRTEHHESAWGNYDELIVSFPALPVIPGTEVYAINLSEPACRACGWSQYGETDLLACPTCGAAFDWA